MDIDTGDSPPISSRPYTLPLKHYEWVQREMESLEWAGVIKKSMSNWVSPIAIVPKKSAPCAVPIPHLNMDCICCLLLGFLVIALVAVVVA